MLTHESPQRVIILIFGDKKFDETNYFLKKYVNLMRLNQRIAIQETVPPQSLVSHQVSKTRSNPVLVIFSA